MISESVGPPSGALPGIIDTEAEPPPAGPLLRLMHGEKTAFVLVGAANTLIGYLFFAGFELMVGQTFGYIAVLLLAHMCSVLCAFVLYRRVVFRVHGNLLRDLWRFEMVYLGALAVNLLLLPVLVEWRGLPVLIAQGLIVFVGALISFFGHKHFSFRRSGPKARALPESQESSPPDRPRSARSSEVSSAVREPPLVSVCIPTYNNSQFVETTVRSVLVQTYAHLEVIVADHGSTDATWEVLQQFCPDPRVRLIQGPPGGGAQANWNRVTDAATGKYFKLCARTIRCTRNALPARSPSWKVMTGSSWSRASATSSMPGAAWSSRAADSPAFAGESLARWGSPSIGSGRHERIRGTQPVMMRTDAVRSAGPWSDALPYLIDEDMYVRVLSTGDLYALDESLATFRLSVSSWSFSLAKQQAVQEPGISQAGARALLD